MPETGRCRAGAASRDCWGIEQSSHGPAPPSNLLNFYLLQVYRARLRPELGGCEVAVKVQRPGVLEAVALDLLLMRKAGQVRCLQRECIECMLLSVADVGVLKQARPVPDLMCKASPARLISMWEAVYWLTTAVT